MPRMYHPNLTPPNNEIDVPDDEGCVRVHTESGWELAPEPTSSSPALAPEPVTYAPVPNAADLDLDDADAPELPKTTKRKSASGS
jgi:hypothetical protein